MADIDVSELLLDPDFVDSFSVVRTSFTVNSDGISQRTEQVLPDIIGAVQPASGRTLMTLAEASRVEGVYEVYTKYALRGPLEGQEADRIIWKGKRMIVTRSNDFTNYGDGYTYAVCTVEGVTD